MLTFSKKMFLFFYLPFFPEVTFYNYNLTYFKLSVKRRDSTCQQIKKLSVSSVDKSYYYITALKTYATYAFLGGSLQGEKHSNPG